MGRPSSYTMKKGNRICELIAEGKSLVTICKGKGMPHYATVMRWLEAGEKEAREGGEIAVSGRAAFRDRYARARRDQAEYYAGEITDIADEPCEDTVAVQRNRLRVEARKWAAAKLLPQKYGEHLEVKIDASSLPPPQVIVQIVNAPKQIENVVDAEYTVSSGDKPLPDDGKQGKTPRLTS